MYVGDIKIQTLSGKTSTIKEAANILFPSGDFYIDVWGYWCGPCLRIKPFLKKEKVLYIHLGGRSGDHTEIKLGDPYQPTLFDYACTDETASKLGVNGVPFVKKVDKDFMMSEERFYPGPEGMKIMDESWRK